MEIALAIVLATCASAGIPPAAEPYSEEVTLDVAQQRWIDGERLSMFVQHVDPSARSATIHLKPRNRQEQEFTLDRGEIGNTMIELTPWRVRLTAIVDEDTATFMVTRGPVR